MRRSLNRGGNYNSGNQNGFASFNLNNPRSNSNVNIGFRSALPPLSLHGLMAVRCCRLTGLLPVHGGKGNCPLDSGSKPVEKKADFRISSRLRKPSANPGSAI